MSFRNKHVVVVIPAHNEAPSIGKVIRELNNLPSMCNDSKLVDEIVVCDNGSTDNTAALAAQAGAQVVSEFRLGYGFACLRCLEFLKHSDVIVPDYVVFVDGDHSVKADEIYSLLEELDANNDLVVGSRVSRLQQQNALGSHQRFGNLLASKLIHLLWRQPVSDLGPFRAMRYDALQALDMQDQRYGWTVEMQVKVIQAGLRYAEVPVTTLQRIGVSKISGTVKGTIGAGLGIFGKVFQLYLQQTKFVASVVQAQRQQRKQKSKVSKTPSLVTHSNNRNRHPNDIPNIIHFP